MALLPLNFLTKYCYDVFVLYKKLSKIHPSVCFLEKKPTSPSMDKDTNNYYTNTLIFRLLYLVHFPNYPTLKTKSPG